MQLHFTHNPNFSIPIPPNPLHPQKPIAVFDIGSGSVAAAVVISGHKGLARIISPKRVTLTHSERSKKQIAAGLKRALSNAALASLDEYTTSGAEKHFGHIREAVVIIHEPWIQSHTNEVIVRLKKPSTITKHIIEEVCTRALNEETPLKKEDIFERKSIRITLNGYPTPTPEGKVASEVRMKVLQSSLDPAISSFAVPTITRRLPGRTISLRSATVMFITIMRARPDTPPSYTILDITSESSACLTIRKQSITQHQDLAVGTRTLLREIAELENATPEEIQSTLRMFNDDTCTENSCQRVLTALNRIEPSLTKRFGETFARVTSENHLPNQLYLAVHPDFSPWFARFLERLDFSQFTETGRPFVVETLTPDHMGDYVEFDPDATPDSGIAQAAAFVHVDNNRKLSL